MKRQVRLIPTYECSYDDPRTMERRHIADGRVLSSVSGLVFLFASRFCVHAAPWRSGAIRGDVRAFKPTLRRIRGGRWLCISSHCRSVGGVGETPLRAFDAWERLMLQEKTRNEG